MVEKMKYISIVINQPAYKDMKFLTYLVWGLKKSFSILVKEQKKSLRDMKKDCDLTIWK